MGKGIAFDPTRYFIFCANVLGSPYGTSSPVSVNPSTGKRWGPEFPSTSVRDDVGLQLLLLQELGVKSIAAVVGGSMGGMAVLEWPLVTSERGQPSFVRNIVAIATSAKHSAWGISWGEAQRQSIYSDPKYNNGYYSPDDPPLTGLAAARMAALLTYRSRDSFESRFGRNEQSTPLSGNDWGVPKTPAEKALAAHNDGLRRTPSSSSIPKSHSPKPSFDPLPSSQQPLIFSAQSYLRYQGDKFVSRFDANCYISITRKMDSHDLSRGAHRPGWPDVLHLLPASTLLIGISSDGLFTLSELKELASHIKGSKFVVVESPEGHDGFLLEFEQINRHLLSFLQERLPEIYEAPPLIELEEEDGHSFKVAKSSVFGEAEAAEPDVTRW
jgi:homoserine O-acetyltransferase